MHISEMFRLVRGTGHILDVQHRDQVALRIHDGASAMDLTARHPSTAQCPAMAVHHTGRVSAGCSAV
ncbi:hypothetical protein OG596_01920 [Streptomyces sp. NBC_01102]|uniref:hypothetical protein n=1 Tax=Streptomyces sp. NBC_01102 TaxID=2903749 RepID=UPI003862D760|nr:hypothetical protein OG596_01920 [Streptomyces sp. NBC_01102]